MISKLTVLALICHPTLAFHQSAVFRISRTATAKSRIESLNVASPSPSSSGSSGNKEETSSKTVAGSSKNDNKAMDFLRKIGRVGGPRQDFSHVIGVDEGSTGKAAGSATSLRKSLSSFRACTETGVIDDLTETFPRTSCGTTWSGYTDQVMGGVSSAILTREQSFHGRTANVLRGRVSMENNGGFVQMATNLAKDPTQNPTVDASDFDGVELEVLYDGADDHENFNVHLKTEACYRPFSSYRATFEVPHGEWTTIRLPFSEFVGNGPGASEVPFNKACLKRLGLVAIGKPMERLVLAVSGFRFYKKGKKLSV